MVVFTIPCSVIRFTRRCTRRWTRYKHIHVRSGSATLGLARSSSA